MVHSGGRSTQHASCPEGTNNSTACTYTQSPVQVRSLASGPQSSDQSHAKIEPASAMQCKPGEVRVLVAKGAMLECSGDRPHPRWRLRPTPASRPRTCCRHAGIAGGEGPQHFIALPDPRTGSACSEFCLPGWLVARTCLPEPPPSPPPPLRTSPTTLPVQASSPATS